MSGTVTPVAEIVAANRPRRADARRNHDALLAAAREVFAERGAEASLDDVAKRAGVGIGTLYRNFPTRARLMESVYADEVNTLCQVAEQLGDLPPWDALIVWLTRFVAYTVTKKAIREALNGESEVFLACRESIYAACEPLFLRAQEAGEARTDMSFDDLIRMIAGITATAFRDTAQRNRVLTVAMDGVRA